MSWSGSIAIWFLNTPQMEKCHLSIRNCKGCARFAKAYQSARHAWNASKCRQIATGCIARITVDWSKGLAEHVSHPDAQPRITGCVRCGMTQGRFDEAKRKAPIVERPGRVSSPGWIEKLSAKSKYALATGALNRGATEQSGLEVRVTRFGHSAQPPSPGIHSNIR